MSIWQNKYLTRRERIADLARDIEGKAGYTLTVTFEYRDENTNQPVLKKFRWNPVEGYFESSVTIVAPAGAYGIEQEPIEARYAEDV